MSEEYPVVSVSQISQTRCLGQGCWNPLLVGMRVSWVEQPLAARTDSSVDSIVVGALIPEDGSVDPKKRPDTQIWPA